MAFPEVGGTRVPARLPFPQVTARALAYMFIFSVTTMSLLSLKRNPGNFWLMAGNRPELGQYLAVNIPDLHQHLPELRYRRSSSLLILFPMESFMDAALPLPHWSREWGLLVPGFHPDFPFFFALFLAHGITPVRPGTCWVVLVI